MRALGVLGVSWRLIRCCVGSITDREKDFVNDQQYDDTNVVTGLQVHVGHWYTHLLPVSEVWLDS